MQCGIVLRGSQISALCTFEAHYCTFVGLVRLCSGCEPVVAVSQVHKRTRYPVGLSIRPCINIQRYAPRRFRDCGSASDVVSELERVDNAAQQQVRVSCWQLRDIGTSPSLCPSPSLSYTYMFYFPAPFICSNVLKIKLESSTNHGSLASRSTSQVPWIYQR